ncbi:MAG: phosphatidylglycerophosphatase A [Candidatus Omnitrophica bacterium]|nr:phosphatidylglycerophosphatase A [Candidatus Omnitrophota bacterium]
MRAIATVFGLGRIPKIPGTAGSAVGLGLSWLLSADPAQQIAGCAVACGLGLWSAGPTARAMGKPDPGPVIIDEVAGMMLALVTLPVTWQVYLAGFILFRFLDIRKPFGLRRLERLSGSWGIMLDDVAAGAAVNVLLQIGARCLR